jgi:hypothetical protein
MLRERRASFVEMYSYDRHRREQYWNGRYLRERLLHHRQARGHRPGRRRRQSQDHLDQDHVRRGRGFAAKVVDTGDASVEVDPGDWAILKVKETVDLPPLDVDLTLWVRFRRADFRLGNDYSKGIILSTGYVGQRTSNNLVTCLTDGHPGVSGGGVLNGDGHLVGIPIGRMQGDYRFSFILPLRARDVPQDSGSGPARGIADFTSRHSRRPAMPTGIGGRFAFWTIEHPLRCPSGCAVSRSSSSRFPISISSPRLTG